MDYSAFLINSLKANNTAISFSYLGAKDDAASGRETFKTAGLPGNFSVISLIVPHENIEDEPQDRRIVGNVLEILRRPFQRIQAMQQEAATTSSDTVYSNFPPVFEYFAQRLQAYFSIYKYPDQSRPPSAVVASSSNIGNDVNQIANTIVLVVKNPIAPLLSDEPLVLLGDEQVETTTSDVLADAFTAKDFDLTTMKSDETTTDITTTDMTTWSDDSTDPWTMNDMETETTNKQDEETSTETNVETTTNEIETTTEILCTSLACAIDDSTEQADEELETTTLEQRDEISANIIE